MVVVNSFKLLLVLFGFILFGTLCASWTCMSISLPQLGKFFVIIFFKQISNFLLSLLLLVPLWCECWMSWSCSESCLYFPYFFLFFFLLIVLTGCFLLPHVPNHWFDSRLHPLHCCFPEHCSLFQLVCPSFLTGSF